MPRQIDLSPQNLAVNNNPNNQLGFTQEQIVNLQDQIPLALEKAEIAFVNSVLAAIDQATGWDLLSFAKQAEAQLGLTGNLATDLWNYIFGASTGSQYANTQLSALITSILGGPGTGLDLASWITDFNSWTTRFFNDTVILLDVFHLVYNTGTPSDPPGTLGVGGVGPGKPTWYSAWNDFLALFGIVNNTSTPAIAAPSIGTTAIPAGSLPNIPAGTGPGQSSDLLTHLDNVASVTGSGGATAVAAALNSLTTITNTLSGLSSKMSGITTGQGQGGVAFKVFFSSYPSGAFSAAPFTTTYTGSGTGHLVLANGDAEWSGVNNGDVSVVGIFNNGGSGQAYTDTDYQELQASLAAYPNGAGSINFALLRCNSTGTDYVYGCIYLSAGYTLNWQIGAVISGTTYVWDSGTNAPLNLNFTFTAGVGTNANRYQGISGDTVVFDHVNTSSDPGGVFPVGSTHRYWGFRSDTYNGGQVYPAPASYVGCADNLPSAIPGSGIRQYCSSSSSVSMGTTANTIHLLTYNYFDTTSASTSSDITPATSTSAIAGCTVATAGRYLFEMRVAMTFATSVSMETICPVVEHFNSSNTLVETILCTGLGAAFNVVGAQAYTSHFGGSCVLPMAAGDYIQIGYYIDGPGSPSSLTFSGDAAGSQTWWDLTLMGT